MKIGLIDVYGHKKRRYTKENAKMGQFCLHVHEGKKV